MKEHRILTNQSMGKKFEILLSQDMEKEYSILLNQDKKETGLAWKMKTLAEQW